jgi:hypothetical protein
MSSPSAPGTEGLEPGIHSPDDEEAWEDYMDYGDAAEAIEDALENPGGIKTMEDFSKDLELRISSY